MVRLSMCVIVLQVRIWGRSKLFKSSKVNVWKLLLTLKYLIPKCLVFYNKPILPINNAILFVFSHLGTALMAFHMSLQRIFASMRWCFFYWGIKIINPATCRIWSLSFYICVTLIVDCLRASYKLIYPQSLTSITFFTSVAFSGDISNPVNTEIKNFSYTL